MEVVYIIATTTICLTRQTDYGWALNPWDAKICAYHLNLSGYLETVIDRRVQPCVSAKFNPGKLSQSMDVFIFLLYQDLFNSKMGSVVLQSFINGSSSKSLVNHLDFKPHSIQSPLLGKGQRVHSYEMERYPKKCASWKPTKESRVKKTCLMVFGTGTSKETKQARNTIYTFFRTSKRLVKGFNGDQKTTINNQAIQDGNAFLALCVDLIRSPAPIFYAPQIRHVKLRASLLSMGWQGQKESEQ